MIWNNDIDGVDICTLADDYAGSTSITFPLEKKARFANKIMRQVWSSIYSVYTGWQYDDSNNTDLPVATTALNITQADYDVPSGGKTVRAVSVLPQGGGTIYQPVLPITEEEVTQKMISEASFMNVSGQPIYYRVIGNSIKLYPASSYTIASGLRITLDRQITAFTATGNDTKQPGFDETYHEIVPIGMAMEYARVNSLPRVGDLKEDFNTLLTTMTKDFARRWQNKMPSKMTQRDGARMYQ